MRLKKIFNKDSVILIGLYLIGVLHWYLFMNWGKGTFFAFDWICIHQWLDVIKQAFAQKVIPYHASYYVEEFYSKNFIWGDRYFATPYVIMSPQVFLLVFLSVKQFLTLQLILIYSIGFWAACQWCKKLNLSKAASVFLIVLLCFNGSLPGRMGVGHLQLTAYMLIPLYLLILYRFVELQKSSFSENFLHSLTFAFFIFFVILQGSLHTAHQMIQVALVFFLFYYRQFFYFILSLVGMALLSFYYIIPNALFSSYTSSEHAQSYFRTVFCGFGVTAGRSGIPIVADHGLGKIINLVYHIWEGLTISFNASFDATWEYSLYVSLLGVLFIVSGAYVVLKKQNSLGQFLRNQWRILAVMGIFILLSLSCTERLVFSLIQKIHPIPAVDRLPCRLMLYPFYTVIIFAALGFDGIFKLFSKNIASFTKWMSLGVLFLLLMANSYGWSFAQTTARYVPPVNDPAGWPFHFMTVIYNRPEDARYISVVNMSYLVTLIAVVALGVLYFWLRRKNRKI